MVVHGRIKTPKNRSFLGGSPSPKGSQSPYILGDTTKPGHVTCVLVWSKSDRRQLRKTLHKQTNRQTERQTNRHYENNGHLGWTKNKHIICTAKVKAMSIGNWLLPSCVRNKMFSTHCIVRKRPKNIFDVLLYWTSSTHRQQTLRQVLAPMPYKRLK